MSNLLDFPPSILPPNARLPPYVVFAICNLDVVQELPPQIPLNAVLHFIPKLKDWLLPAPSTATLPKPLARVALRSPYVGIDIQSYDVTALGLKWVIKKILQASGLVHPKTLFSSQPSVGVAATIYRTWKALDLPVAGVTNLLTHIQSQLMMGPPVATWEMNIIWQSFPHDSDIVREMGMNSIRSYLNFEYAPSDTAALLEWYWMSDERRQFFNSIEHYFPDMHTEREQAANATSDKFDLSTKYQELPEAGRREKRANHTRKKVRGAAEKVTTVLEKDGTRKVSPRGRKERQREDNKALQTRMKRTRSDDSIRSVETAIWDPPERRRETAYNDTSDQKSLNLLSKSGHHSQTLQAESDRKEDMSRGRQRTRKDLAPTLTAEHLTQVNETLSINPKTANPKRQNPINPARRRNTSEASEERSTLTTTSHIPASSSTAPSTASSIAAAKQRDPEFGLLRSLDLLMLRKAKTIRKKSGREGLEEAKKESVGPKMPFGHAASWAQQAVQDTLNLRRSSTVVSRTTGDGFKADVAGRGNAGEERRVSDLD